MNITVRVSSARAQSEIRALRAQVAALERQLAMGSAASAGFTAGMNNGSRGMIRFGNQLQWTGRQLQYNWTLPLLLAGGMAAKWALENEKAMTRVVKVYGDSSMSTRVLKNETNALADTFAALSSKFGVNQKEVIETAAAWAQAGVSGIALAKSVELSMRAMVLGELEAAAATEALIAIQAQYGLSVSELSDTLAQLNAVENQTGISMGGLIDGFQRAAGVARTAGVDTRHLAAMLAAISPAAGTAAQAGNSLKTIISRITAPTREAVDVLSKMGIGIEDVGWKSLSATQKLSLLATKFNKLDDAQKSVVSTVLASRYQINRFDVLMRELADTHGFYQKALDATANRSKYLRTAEKELGAVLASNPKRLEILWNTMKNGMADVIQPAIPLILMLAGTVAGAINAFRDLDPAIQKTVLVGLLLLALVGPIGRYIGSLITLVGVLRPAMAALGGAALFAVRGLMGFLLLPFTLAGRAIFGMAGAAMVAGRAIGVFLARAVVMFAAGPALAFRAAIVSMVVMARTGMRAVVAWVARGAVAAGAALLGPWGLAIAAVVLLVAMFWDEIKAVFSNVVEFFQGNGAAIAEAFSPVVEFFKGGADLIQRAFNALPQGVQDAIMAVVRVVADAALQVYEWLSYLNPFARHSPSLVEQVKKGMKLIRDEFGDLKAVSAPLERAKRQMKALGEAIAAQEKFVKSLDKALDVLKNRAKFLGDQLEAAKQKVQDFANTPIKGMRAMEDAIFENEMAQKRLRLELLRMEEAVGPIDQIEGRLSSIRGEIELLRGQQAALRASGAGSEILGVYDEQIRLLEEQQRAIEDQVGPINDIQKQLEDLARAGEILDLEKSLKFDSLLRQIDQLANGMTELPFDQIMNGIRQNQAEVTRLSAAYDAAEAAVARAQSRYDREQEQLSAMRDRYSELSSAIREAEQALAEFERASQKRAGGADQMTPGGRNFLKAAGGNYADVAGTGQLGREFPGIEDQTSMIEEYTRSINEEMAAAFQGINIFAPIKRMWNSTWGWLKTNVPKAGSEIAGLFSGGFSTGGGESPFAEFARDAQENFGWVKDVASTFWSWLQKAWDLIGPFIQETLTNLFEGLQHLWKEIQPELKELAEMLGPLGEALGNVWKIAKPFLGILLVSIALVIAAFWGLINGAIKPIFEIIAAILKGAIKIITGILKIFVGLFTLNFGMMRDGVVDIVEGLWGTLWGVFKGAVKLIWGIIKGFVMGIVNFFKWLFDVLVGHSIIPDMINSIIDWFASLPGKALDAVLGLINMLVGWAEDLWSKVWGATSGWWTKTLWPFFRDLPKNIIAKIVSLVTKIASWARDVWNAAWNAMKSIWSKIIGWLAGLPASAISKLASLVTKLGNLGKDGFNRWWTGMKNIWTEVSKWLGGLPEKAADKMKGMGAAVAKAVKASWNGAANFLNKNIIGNINKVTGMFGAKIPKLPTFARGGVIPGPISAKDNILIHARTGEGVIIPEAVRALGGKKGVDAFNSYFRNGPHKGRSVHDPAYAQAFADGGVVGAIGNAGNWVKDKISDNISDLLAKGAGVALDTILKPVPAGLRKVMPNGFTEDFMVGIAKKWRTEAKKWGDKKERESGLVGGPFTHYSKGWPPRVMGRISPNTSAAANFVRNTWGINNIGTLGSRPNASDHPWGKALDIMIPGWNSPQGIARGNRIANWFAHNSDRFGTKYLIWRKRFNGGGGWIDYGHPTGRSNPTLDHMDHVHVSLFDKGGFLKPGWNLSYNGTGQPEAVLNPAMMDSIMRNGSAVGTSTRARGYGSMRSVLSDITARATSAASHAGQETWGNVTHNETHFHFHGDLSFPNISDGNDASEFVKNLEALAG